MSRGGPGLGAGTAEAVDCLVLDANLRQALAVARSLGRGGRTVAMAESSDAWSTPIPAFSSTFVSSTAALPSLSAAPDAYASSLLELLERRPASVVIPAMDASIAALRPRRERIEKEAALALASEAALDVANDKVRTMALADQLGFRTPRSVAVGASDQVAGALAQVGLPAVIKPVQSWVRGPWQWKRLVPQEVVDEGEGVALCDEMLRLGSPSLLVQEWIPGRREAFCAFYARGRAWAEFAMVAHRTSPILGGYCVLRESIAMPNDLRRAVGLLEALDLEGFSEIEFRRDALGGLVLMEINARLSGTLELPIRAGIDFPRYLWDWAMGLPLEPSRGYKAGVRLRYLYGDIQWLLENMKQRGERPDSVPRARALGRFSADFFRPAGYDYVDLGDPGPALRATARGMVGAVRRAHAKVQSVLDSPVDPAGSLRRHCGEDSTNTVIIGAGPYGLSLAAHLAPLGVEHRIFGTPMGAWKHNMPDGMVLKSEPYATDICAPVPGFGAGDHARFIGAPYAERMIPLTRQRFVDYGEWFADRLVPSVEDVQIAAVERSDTGFVLTTGAGDRLSARRVVVATGVVPFAHIPAVLADAGAPDLITHSSVHRDLSRFRGADVVVVGGGQSAVETAALLNEAGARPRLVIRGSGIHWPAANPARPGLRYRLRHPPARLCEGWACAGYTKLPDLFRLLPERQRVERARTFLGPAGSWWLRPRVEGVVPMLIGTEVVSACRVGDRIQLDLFGPGPSVIECDHVIAATGYRYDLDRLQFLGSALRGSIRVTGGAPLLDRSLGSSVPNLHFMGALSSPSMGPLMRFVAGTHFAAPRLASAITSKERRHN